ncbi:hypothetical protein DXV75_01645 [Alteromonas aestuariivivens]|uniref:Transglutaminase domain-containing protein n=1 Tax=Alteromonas aestuariivivens TaxID=1938339 RepID=A0A3D8MF13_9ALTE|nr:hypothetical protein [Alteromonas aestuariivivens]RDV29190.1 hypothetical protein DXV75_01645 [Alteromonas aestuariivivens]
MKRLFSIVLIAVAVMLFAINLYGLRKSLNPDAISAENLRFGAQDVSITPDQLLLETIKRADESPQVYVSRLTQAISGGLAHIHWESYEPGRFNQRVPVWENYLLYAMGLWSGIPEYQRYHFSSPEKSIERGIGICGDASMLMSQLLDRNQIANKIITVPGHVMVEVDYGDRKQLLDPDFGIVLQHDLAFYQANPKILEQEYNQAGYTANGEDVVVNGMSAKAGYWNGVRHFITKKYYFEKISYWAIWLIPVFLMLSGVFLLRRNSANFSSGDC